MRRFLACEGEYGGKPTGEALAALLMMKKADSIGMLPAWCCYACTQCDDVLRCAVDGRSNIDCIEPRSA